MLVGMPSSQRVAVTEALHRVRVAQEYRIAEPEDGLEVGTSGAMLPLDFEQTQGTREA